MVTVSISYALLIASILWLILRREYVRLRLVHPDSSGLEWLAESPDAASNSRPRTSGRVNNALRGWSDGRAEADLSVITTTCLAPQADLPCGQPQSSPSKALHGSCYVPVRPEPIPEPSPVKAQAPPEPEPFEAESGIRFTVVPRSHYEVLQISTHADLDTIHRVYRIMAARFHPDNQVTGDLERFLALTQAYKVLSDASLRAQYDATLQIESRGADAIFGRKVFLDGVDGENNRRLGVLSLLYHRRRLNDSQPGMSVLELERRMAFPREYLHFTLWYLRAKEYIMVMQDNSDYALTALGVDYVEANASTNQVIRELLTAASGAGGGEVLVLPEPGRSRSEGKERSRNRRAKKCATAKR
jgi:hypothetical protein